MPRSYPCLKTKNNRTGETKWKGFNRGLESKDKDLFHNSGETTLGLDFRSSVYIIQEVRGQRMRIKADCRVSDVGESKAARAGDMSPNQEESRLEQERNKLFLYLAFSYRSNDETVLFLTCKRYPQNVGYCCIFLIFF